MSTVELFKAILDCVSKHEESEGPGVAAGFIQAKVNRPRPTVNRALASLVAAGKLEKTGAGRSISYRINTAYQASATETNAFQWSKLAQDLKSRLMVPMGARTPIGYQRSFVEGYVPNHSTLLPAALASELFQAGKSRNQLPAGTYARKVLEQLLIDLSWSSSRLEGNRKSLLDTRELFEKGRADSNDPDSIMLLNHKAAIEFLVDAVPIEGITVPVVRNLQSILMQNLLDDLADVGSIRRKIVNIQDSVYVPSQAPQLLEEMLGLIVSKAKKVHNPVEAAFFLWVNIAYLQPFVDGNKRTSRLAANMPFLLTNCSPLSFLDVGPHEYALAMLAVYEKLDVSLAVELFEWTYRRSIQRYQVVVESMGGPNVLRVRYREQLTDAVLLVVFHRFTAEKALAEQQLELQLELSEQQVFMDLLHDELKNLQPYNCARHRLSMDKTAEWIKQGRPC